MIKLIGIRRILILAALLGINIVVALAYFVMIEPMRTDAQGKLNGINDEISTLQGKIQSTQQDLADYKANLPKFKELQSKGFMSNQDRFDLSKNLDRVRDSAGIAKFAFDVHDIEHPQNTDAKTAKMQLLKSQIDINRVESVLDINFYDFLDKMERDFPQQVLIDSFEIKRGKPVDPETLQKIAARQPVELITAHAVFDWYTMVPMPDPANPNAPKAP